jgi:hypothetical protein
LERQDDLRHQYGADVQTTERLFGDEYYVLQLSDNIWKIANNRFGIDLSAIRLKFRCSCSPFTLLTAKGFASPYDSSQYDFEKEDYIAIIALSDGLGYTPEVAAASVASGCRCARASGSTTMFVLDKSAMKSISKSFDDLLSKEKNS